MKIRASFFFILLAFAFLPLRAQLYHGLNTAEIESTGTQKTTNLSSPQWVCEFDMGNQILEMKAKLAAFGFTADANGKDILNNVFFVDANPLIRVDVNFSQLALQNGTTREELSVSLPVEIRFNEQQVRTQANITQFRQNPKSIQMNLDIPLNLQDMGLSATGTHTASFSNSFVLKVSNLEIKAR